MAETNLKKNKDGYGYKYTELAEIHNYLEQNNMKYYQEIEVINGQDYIMTHRYIDGKWEEKPIRGCRVVDATLNGIKNPAQEQGSALTYARRYSLLMAFGLATEDDDAASLTANNKNESVKKATSKQIDMIESLCTDEEIEKIYQHYKINKLEDLTIQDASTLIGRKTNR